MDWKQLGMDAINAAKPGLKAAVKGIVVEVVAPKLVDPAIDWVAKIIPGKWDDAFLMGAKPQIKDALISLASAL